jgi:hypothetical protein
MAQETVTKKSEPVAADGIVAHLVARARAREASILRERKAAPMDVRMGAPTWRNSRRDLERMYAPETVDHTEVDQKTRQVRVLKRAKRSEFWTPPEKLPLIVDQGYVPVTNERGELVKDEGGDVLCTRDRSLRDAEMASAARQSRSRLPKKHNELAAESPVDGQNAGQVSEDSVEIEQGG